LANPLVLKPGGDRGPAGNTDWQLWFGCPGVPVVVSAATGLVRNGIATRDTIASIKKSLDEVMIFPLRLERRVEIKMLLSR
jgi:hypothetical protein